MPAWSVLPEPMSFCMDSFAELVPIGMGSIAELDTQLVPFGMGSD